MKKGENCPAKWIKKKKNNVKKKPYERINMTKDDK